MRIRDLVVLLYLAAGLCLVETIPGAAFAQSSPPTLLKMAAGHSGVVASPGQRPLIRLSTPSSGAETSPAVSPKTSAGGLTIIPTFDSSITTNPNAQAIEGSIDAAIEVFESLISNPLTISIYFRYSPTQPGGGPADLSNSYYVYYFVSYGSYITALKAASATANDATALSNLPAAPLANNIGVNSALGRALGMNTPGAVDSNGGINNGGTFDGIVTLNSSYPIQFSRTGGISAGSYDALRLIEHEMDEVIGFGSILPGSPGSGAGSLVRPQDLFRYSGPGATSLTTSASATAYFSIDGGATGIIGFNQDSGGDYGDWLSPACASEAIIPLVQYAFLCPGTAADVSATSPEGIGLDVIGYHLRAPAATAQTISFGALSNVMAGAPPFTLSATSNSGLPVTFVSDTTTVCAISGVTATLVAPGTCFITAIQPGNSAFAAAAPVTRTFLVAGQTQTIAFGSLPNETLGTGPFPLSATASSGLGVIFASNTPVVCTVSGAAVTLVAAGACSITASQPGNSLYDAAAPVTQTFTVNPGDSGPQSSPLQLITVAPCRVMDTRNPNGPLGGPFIAGGTNRVIPIPESPCNVPANAAAYSLNFTVVPRGPLAYLTVWAAGEPQPLVSTLNSLQGLTIANAAIVPAGIAGAIDAFADSDTDLVVDINGYFVPPSTGSLQFYPLTPCRVLDTRTLGSPLAAGVSRTFAIASTSCGTLTNATAYALNLTVVPQGGLGYLTVWPEGQPQPVVSTLNSLDGTVLANAAIVPAGAGGLVNFYASNTTDLVVDINGYFAPPRTNGLNFYTLTPCRLVDTRNPTGTLGGPTMGANTTRIFPVSQASCGLPTVQVSEAYSLNVTVVPQGVLGYLSLWPTGATQPVVSTLNAYNGQVVANAAIVPAGGSGSIDVFVTNTTDVVIDTNGYFAQ